MAARSLPYEGSVAGAKAFDEIELLPCPFCGNHLKHSAGHNVLLTGHTDDCFLKGKPTFSDDLEAWNRRSPALLARVRELEEVLKWYAEPQNYLDAKPEVENGQRISAPVTSIQADCGRRARAALADR